MIIIGFVDAVIVRVISGMGVIKVYSIIVTVLVMMNLKKNTAMNDRNKEGLQCTLKQPQDIQLQSNAQAIYIGMKERWETGQYKIEYLVLKLDEPKEL